MKQILRVNKLYYVASKLEFVIGFFVLIICVICGLGLIIRTDILHLFGNVNYFQEHLANIFYIIMGIEIIKLIANHTIDAVVDVLLLAIARQMIIEHASPLQNLISIIAVAVLFVIRKYLSASRTDSQVQKLAQ